MLNELRSIIAEQGQLSVSLEELGDEGDLFAAGMDSLAVVDIMMAIEDRFGIEIPDSLLNRRTFSSVAALDRARCSVAVA
jgi:acyl carrier protein